MTTLSWRVVGRAVERMTAFPARSPDPAFGNACVSTGWHSGM
ncbi:hypothetical protein ACWEOA_39855 [Streptomyces sp. NPDC004457]